MGRRGGWVAAGPIVAALAASSGCRWIPARHPDRPSRPDPALASAEDGVRTPLPPLPAMRPINDDEAFHPGKPTPLLDAAAERDAAIQRAIAEVRPEATGPDTPGPAEPAHQPEPSPQVQIAPRADRLVEPASFAPPSAPHESPAEPPPVPATEPSGDDGTLWDYVLSALAESSEPEAAPDPMPAARPVPEAARPRVEPALTIADLRVCRRVLGFGRTEPLAAGSVAPSQAFLLYCEVEGLRDEETTEGFRSRLGATVAILAKGATDAVWTGDLGIAEDICRRRRRDFFLSYRLTVPADLPPGTYEVRITNKDLLAGRDATRSVELVVRAK